MKKNIKWLFLVSLTFMAACNSDDNNDTPEEVPVTPGSAVFTKYIALGDSFAAGYSDNALFKKGQENAYPNILAQQFAAAGGGSFATPFMNDNVGGLLLGGNVIFGGRLYFNGKAPVSITGKPTTEVTSHLNGSFNNLGIPGAKSYHLAAPGYGNVAGVATGQANPYFARFASSPSTSVIADAVGQAPTFFSLFIGGNDVLGYAISGGVGKDQTGNMNPATYGSSDITDPTVFKTVYSSLITALTANGAKGVVANLPFITTLPYFTTVPYNPVALTKEAADQLNAGYAVYNGGLKKLVEAQMLTQAEADKRKIEFKAGNNAVVIVDSYLTNLSAAGLPSYRHATKDDLIVLTASSFIGTKIGDDPTKVNGVSVPLADNWVLSKDEVDEVKKATVAYNAVISAIAEEKGLAFVDTGAIMTQLSSGGVRFGNYVMSSTFVTGGAFSLDGVHPSARGYGLIANIFIDAINKKYGSTLRHVDLGAYPIQYPASL
ncbi:SGNH/GDSL hydrolase family protein [Flavobacterium gelatinilyticum]|uniref:SGNH/GDSL hydrolase family protein n=1 Tax=Flavobacterium gelatinilyticum TaxID=3003260 RepID=UPI0024803BF4|nr:SGNH/GDSL hydrolase family protein [Flavobacterium gelatinilyticum]